MARRLYPNAFFTLLGGLLLAACAGASPGGEQGAPTQAPAPLAEVEIVVEGRLAPRRWVDLSFVTNGQVAEVLVEEGDVVQAGSILARLGKREQLESAVAQAELELLAARLELLSAQQELDDLFENLPEAQTQALQAMTEARQAVRDAERRVNNLNSPAGQVDIDSAWASVVLAKDRLDQAREDYEPYAGKPEDNLTRAAYLNKLAEMQRAYDEAVRRYNNLSGISGSEFDLNQAQAELSIAEARLAQAQKDYALLQNGPDPVLVSLAESRIDAAQARIAAAVQALDAARSALADLELRAAIDGTVVNLDLIPGQQVSAGEPVVKLADFSQWYVETENLTEIEVVDVARGQNVTVLPDALPSLQLAGEVETISDEYEEKRGDVTYTVRIRLGQADPRLRWGMTAGVTFEK